MRMLEDIVVDPEFASAHRPLTDDEREQLVDQIQRFGFRDPLVVWAHHDILLDGHQRYGIWQERFSSDVDGPFPDIVEIHLKTRELAREWINRNQRARRNLTPNEIAKLRGEEYNTKRKKVGAPKGNRNAEKNNGNQRLPLNTTATAVAQKHGVTKQRIHKDAKFSNAVDAIAENVSEEAKAEVLSDKPPMSRAAVIRVSQQPPETQAIAYKKEKEKKSKPPRRKRARRVNGTGGEFSAIESWSRIQTAIQDALKSWPDIEKPKAVHWLRELASSVEANL